MRILVTGAAGRIGTRLTRRLVQQGHAVRALVLPGDPRASAIGDLQLEVACGRLEDPKTVVEAARGVEAVFHLGAALTSRGNTDEEFFETNLRGTFNLLKAVREHAARIRHFVYASSDAVYWGGPTQSACYLPVDEAHPRLAGTVYGASKIGAEELCLAFWRGFGVPATILRFGATFEAEELIDPKGVFGRRFYLQAMMRDLGTVRPPTAEQTESLEILKRLDIRTDHLVIVKNTEGNPVTAQYADARDVAKGCALVLETKAAVGEVLNLGGGAPFATDELVRYMADRIDLPFVAANLPLARTPWYISSAKARELLGYRPQYTVFDMVDDALAKQPSQWNQIK